MDTHLIVTVHCTSCLMKLSSMDYVLYITKTSFYNWIAFGYFMWSNKMEVMLRGQKLWKFCHKKRISEQFNTGLNWARRI